MYVARYDLVTLVPIGDFVAVHVYSPTSKLLYIYEHLDKNSIPKDILEHSWTPVMAHERFDLTYKEFEVKEGDKIGELQEWGSMLKNDVKIPSEVKDKYGRAMDHFHLEILYVGDNLYIEAEDKDQLLCVNPLQLLIPLYDIPKMAISSGRHVRSRL